MRKTCLDIRLEVLAKVTVIALDGELTYETEATFKRMTSLDVEDRHYVILNFKALRSIDSTGLGSLVTLMRAMSPGEHDSSHLQPVKLCHVNPEIRMLLKATRLDRCFPIFATEAEALATIPSKSVLLIEESEDAIQLLNALFGLQGYAVMVDQYGSQAVDMLTNSGADLIVMEPAMQGTDGWSLLDKICRSFDIPMVITSIARQREAAEYAPVRYWFTKPFDTIQFLTAVQGILGERANLQSI